MLVARSTTRCCLVEPVVAEAMTTIHAVDLCRVMKFFDIIVEGDTLQIVTAVKLVGKS